jgi:hypothetical protein
MVPTVETTLGRDLLASQLVGDCPPRQTLRAIDFDQGDRGLLSEVLHEGDRMARLRSSPVVHGVPVATDQEVTLTGLLDTDDERGIGVPNRVSA